MSFVPSRGDIVWLSFQPQAGHEQAGRRPALVISPREYNARVGLALFCPITSRAKGYPFEVPLPPDPSVHGVILADQVKSLDWRARNAEPLAVLPGDLMAEVLGRLLTLVEVSVRGHG